MNTPNGARGGGWYCVRPGALGKLMAMITELYPTYTLCVMPDRDGYYDILIQDRGEDKA